MDNITHTLIGTLVGEVVARAAPSNRSNLPAPLRRNLCVTLAAIGSNLPDSDLLYSFFGGKVNYLLHHRGHTHTIVIALLLGAAVMGITRWWLRRRGLQPSRQDLLLLMGILLFTPLLHIGMDFTNNYGVHPLWPFNNQWFYGDSVFIIEPLFWAACAPLAVISERARRSSSCFFCWPRQSVYACSLAWCRTRSRPPIRYWWWQCYFLAAKPRPRLRSPPASLCGWARH